MTGYYLVCCSVESGVCFFAIEQIDTPDITYRKLEFVKRTEGSMRKISWDEWERTVKDNLEKNKDVTFEVKLEKEKQLLQNIAARKEEILSLFEKGEAREEDRIYRFYHHSFKVFDLQEDTRTMINLFVSLLDLTGPEELNDSFMSLMKKGTGKEFTRENMQEMNMFWEKETSPIVEAYFHAKYMLKMIVKYGIEQPIGDGTEGLPSGWVAVLYLYNI